MSTRKLLPAPKRVYIGHSAFAAIAKRAWRDPLEAHLGMFTRDVYEIECIIQRDLKPDDAFVEYEDGSIVRVSGKEESNPELPVNCCCDPECGESCPMCNP